MRHDLSKLFSGSDKPSVELVLGKIGPFTGKRMRLAAFDRRDEGRSAGLSVEEFAKRNGVRFWKDAEQAFLVGDATEI